MRCLRSPEIDRIFKQGIDAMLVLGIADLQRKVRFRAITPECRPAASGRQAPDTAADSSHSDRNLTDSIWSAHRRRNPDSARDGKIGSGLRGYSRRSIARPSCYAPSGRVVATCVRRALHTARKPFHRRADRICGTAVQLFGGSGCRVVHAVSSRCLGEQSTGRHAGRFAGPIHLRPWDYRAQCSRKLRLSRLMPVWPKLLEPS
jgi:hypothetical protein